MTYKLPLGIGLTALGLYSFVTSARIRKRSRRTNGRIVRYVTSTSKHYDDISASTSYIPVVAFRTPEGTDYECKGDSTPRVPKIGAKVQLEYDPVDPRTAWERGSGTIWVLPFLFTAGGVVLVILGLRDYWGSDL